MIEDDLATLSVESHCNHRDVRRDDLDQRTERALTESMLVFPQADEDAVCVGLFTVVSFDGTTVATYAVDTVDGASCTCPDATHRDVTCKHIRRVRLAQEQTPLPEAGADVAPYLTERLSTLLVRLRRTRVEYRQRAATLDDVLEEVSDSLDAYDLPDAADAGAEA